jgi:hypothetical protein
MMNTHFIFVVGMLLLLVSIPAVAQEDRFIQDRLAIGFWVDPPMDERAGERYAEIAEANFTMIIGGFGAAAPDQVKRQLALCEQFDLKAIVASDGIPAGELPESSACWGYKVKDEPGAAEFPALRARTDEIRQHRPGRLAYINLFPDYANKQQLGTRTYDEHVRRFVEEVRPDVLSMDHYPAFRPDADGRDGYCGNLEVMRKYSLAADIPFWNFFNIMPFGPHYDPAESQVRWQIYASMAYGAKGVLYFCYYTPISHEFPKGGAIIARDDRPTRHYDQARRINAELKQLGPVLMQLTSKQVIRLPRGAEYTGMLAGSGIREISDGDYLLGVFRHVDGRRALLLMNYEHAYTSWPTVVFDAPHDQVIEVSKQDGSLAPLRDDSPDMDGLQIRLDAGEGRLFLLP